MFLYFPIFREMDFSSSNIKNFLYFLKKIFSYISGNGNSEKFLIFQETELSYISGNGSPRKLLIFQK